MATGGSEATRQPASRSVLFVTSNLPRWEGDSTTPFVLHLAQDLQELGWNVDILAPHAPGAAAAETLSGVDIHRFRYLWPESQETVCYGGGALINLRKSKSNLAKLPMLVGAEWLSLSRKLASRRYAAIHSHWILPQGFVSSLAPSRRVARLLTVHGGDIFGLQGAGLSAFKKLALQRADAVTVNSSATEAAVKQLCSPSRVVQIPMGVTEVEAEPTAVEKVRAEHRRGEGPFVVFVGRLVDEKGVADVLEAVDQLQTSCPDVTAVVVGEGQDRAAFEAQAAELGLGERVRFTGWVPPEEVPAYLAAGDVFVAPSRRGTDGWTEAQGLTIAEAMMAGVPVIATALGGITDAVTDNETGVLVDERAPDQIAKAIERLHHDHSLARGIADRGQRLARERYGRRQSAGRFSDLLDELIAKKQGSRQ